MPAARCLARANWRWRRGCSMIKRRSTCELAIPVRGRASLEEESRRFFSSGRFPSDDEEVARELADTEHLLAKLPLHVAARQGRQLDAIGLGARTRSKLPRRTNGWDAARTGPCNRNLGRLETMAGRHEAAMAYLSTAAELSRELHDLLCWREPRRRCRKCSLQQISWQRLSSFWSSRCRSMSKRLADWLAFVRRSVEKLAQRVKITESSEAPTSRRWHGWYEDLLAAEDQLGRAKLPSDG